jgi:hypothetical protein
MDDKPDNFTRNATIVACILVFLFIVLWAPDNLKDAEVVNYTNYGVELNNN